MVRLLISLILGSFYFTLCAGGLSNIFKGKSWLQDVELVAKPIVLKEGNGMPMMEMKSMGNGMTSMGKGMKTMGNGMNGMTSMENSKQMNNLKFLVVKTLAQQSTSNGGNGGGNKEGSSGWEAEDIKAWETPKAENKGGNENMQQQKPEGEKWVLVKVKVSPTDSSQMMMKPAQMEPPMMMMMMMKAEGPSKMTQKPETPMEQPQMMMMDKPENKGWEPQMEPPKMMMMKPQPQVESWKPLDIKAWESPMEPPKMMMKQEQPMNPPKMMMMMNPESKGWQPQMQPPQMMMAMTPAEPPMEPPKQSEKWVLVKVQKPESQMETSKSNEMQSGNPWKTVEAAAAFWEKTGKSNGGGGEAWQTADTRDRPFILGYNSGLKSALEERENSRWRKGHEETPMPSQNEPITFRY